MFEDAALPGGEPSGNTSLSDTWETVISSNGILTHPADGSAVGVGSSLAVVCVRAGRVGGARSGQAEGVGVGM